MGKCPHCSSPVSSAEAPDGRCPVCGMALSDTRGSETTPAAAEPVGVGTLQPASPSGEKATIDFESQPPEDDTASPKGIDLIKPRELSPEYARRVTAAWQNTRSQFIDPKETIKSEKPGVFDTAGLNIGTRVVAGEGDSPEVKDYKLEKVIGQGAMGTVWSAWQSSLNREVAIKMPRGSAKTDAGRKQFMSEVVVTGQLDHPNIVPIYDLAKDNSGELFYSMKKVEGRPWNEILQNEERSLQENLEILMKVCDAIRFAHDRGVIHRDIKPHNIMIGQYGEVSVMDWGIALRMDEESRLSSVTRISPAGTPAYMAPEMATGHAGAIGPHTDVYLLGAVLYEILTREPPHPPPYDSKNYNEILNDALLIAARNEIPPIKTGGELADITYKALATDVEHRFQSVQDFQDAVREYYSHAESINLTERGEMLLSRARTNGRATHNGADRFDDFDRARFAFEEALAIWPGNRTARKLQGEAILSYANYAYDEGAYARGIALLSEVKAEHKDLLKKLKKARRRTNSLSYMLKAAALLIVVGTSAFSVVAYTLWTRAEIAKNDAVAAQEQEKLARINAQKAEQSALAAKTAEEKEKKNALAAKETAEKARLAAEAAEAEKEKQRLAAVKAREDETKAKLAAVAAEGKAQTASYENEIGLAAEELQRNAFDRVRDILKSQTDSETKRPLRKWEWGHLQALANQEVRSFDDGNLLRERIEAATISNDQKYVAAGTNEGDLYVWQSDRSQRPVKLAYGKSVNAVAFTPDMVLAAGRQEDGRHTVKAWPLSSLEEAQPKVLASHIQPLLSLDVSSDSSKLVVGCQDGKVILWNLNDNSELNSFAASKVEDSIWSARFSADDKWIVTAGEDQKVCVWNTDMNPGADEAIRPSQLFESSGSVYTADFAPNGQYVVSGGSDGRLLAWPFDPQAAANAKYSAVEPIRQRLADTSNTISESGAIQIGEHEADIRSLSFSKDGQFLFTAGNDHTVRVWNMGEGLRKLDPVKTLRGHGGWVRSCVALPNDPQSVLSAGYDHRVQVWNWEQYSFPRFLSKKSPRSFGDTPPPLTAGAATRDGQWVATGSSTGLITVWDLQNPLQPKGSDLSEGHDWQATTAIYFDGGRRLLTAGGDNAALVWDEQRGNELVRLGGWYEKTGAGWRGVADVSSDGRRIATGAQDTILARVWDAQTGELIAEIPGSDAKQVERGEKREATALAFSPDGETLLVGDQWGACLIARAAEGWRGQTFQAHPGKVSGIEFVPTGERFLTASYDGTVQQWNIETKEPVREATFQHDDRVIAMDLDNDGKMLITAAGSQDNQAVLRVWDRSQNEPPTHALSLSEIGGGQAEDETEELMVRAVSLHPSEPRALVTIFDPQNSEEPYRIGSWEWTQPKSSSPYRLASEQGLRDLSTAVFAPHRGESAILTVGGRGAQLRTPTAKAMPVSMSYRPQSTIRSLSFSADGQRLVSASDDGTLKVWQLDAASREWKPAEGMIGHTSVINRVVFHPTANDTFLTASADGSAKVWQLRSKAWKAVRTLSNTDGQAVLDAAFVGQDNIVTVGEAGALVWGPEGDPRKIEGIVAPQCVTPSPDDKWLLIASGPKAHLVDAGTLTVLPAELSHSADITDAAFTSDGSRLFTSSADNTVKLWNAVDMVGAANGASQQRELLTLEEHKKTVTSVMAVSESDSPIVVTTSLDGQTIVWPNRPAE